MTAPDSVPPGYFEAMYASDDDPWGFASRPYESAKYAETLNVLRKERYGSAFEIGCSIGVLSEKLACVADAFLAVDVSERALELARDRCRHLPHARFEHMHVPREFPSEMFDLVVVSEVGYYWSREDLTIARARIISHMVSGGDVLLVHWTPAIDDAPLSGDEVHDAFLEVYPGDLRHVVGKRASLYRIDLFTKPA